MSRISDYYIKCVETTEDFHSVKNKWKKLETDSKNKNITASYDFQITWWNSFKDRSDIQIGHKKELRILLLFKANILIGIAPFVKVTRKTRKFINRSSIEFIGQQWGGTLLDFVGHLSEEEIEKFFKWIYENEKFDYFLLNNTPQYSAAFKNREKYLSSACPSIHLPDYKGYEQYRTSVYSKNLKQNIRSAYNRSNKLGEFISFLNMQEINENEFKIIIPLSYSKIKDKKKKHTIYSESDKREFMFSLMTTMKSEVLYVTVNNTAVIYRINLIYNNCLYVFDAGYDRDYPHYNLGRLSIDKNIQNSFNMKYDLYCEGTGTDNYKLYFCKDLIKLYYFIARGNTAVSSVLFYPLKRKLERRHRRLVKTMAELQQTYKLNK